MTTEQKALLLPVKIAQKVQVTVVMWSVFGLVLGVGLLVSLSRAGQGFSKVHQEYASRRVIDETEDVDFVLLMLEQPDRLWLYCTVQTLAFVGHLLLVGLLLGGMLLHQEQLGKNIWHGWFLVSMVLVSLALLTRRFLWMAHLYLFARDRRDARLAAEKAAS